MKRKLSRTAAILLTLLASALAARAQTDAPRPPEAPAQTPAAPATREAADDLACTANSPRASANENFELNITERHIVRECFDASTDVSLGQNDARGVLLRVGVNARAERIDVWLRGVRGRVRFRSSLEELLRRIGARTAAPDSISR